MNLGREGRNLRRRVDVAAEEDDTADVQSLQRPSRFGIELRSGNADDEQAADIVSRDS
jgi:hypothetical protein